MYFTVDHFRTAQMVPRLTFILVVKVRSLTTMCLCLALIICKPLALTMYLFTSYFPGYFDRLVSAVYNLAYIQALFHVSCKFNDEEKKSWLTRTPSARSRDGSTSQYQCNLLPVVLKPLMTVGFYPPDDATTSVSSPLPHFHIKNS